MTMREDCRHYDSRTYPSGDVVRKCRLDLAPEAPWKCPENCSAFERRMIDAGWQYGSLTPKPETPTEPPPDMSTDVAALLDEAEDIVNAASMELQQEMSRKQRRGRFRKRKK